MWGIKIIIILSMIMQLSFCDELIELLCKSDSDCQSYQDKSTMSSCRNSVCICLNVNTQIQVKCTPKKIIVNNKLGDCRTNPCGIPNSHCVLETNKCVCDQDFMENSDGSRCIKTVVQLNKSCEMNEQCVKFDRNAVCSDGVCLCLKNFTLHDNSCRSLVKIGEHCESHMQCHKFTTNITCLDHRCACDIGFVATQNGDFCLPYAYYLESCKEENQCKNGLGPGSLCDNGKCVCDPMHLNVTDGKKTVCQRQVRHGDECKEHGDCTNFLGEYTMHCNQHKCQCRDNYELFDANDGKCVRITSGASFNDAKISSLIIFVVFASFVQAFLV